MAKDLCLRALFADPTNEILCQRFSFYTLTTYEYIEYMGTLLLTICFAAKDIADAVAQALKAIGAVAVAAAPPPPPPLAPPARVDPAPGAARRTNLLPCHHIRVHHHEKECDAMY